MFIPTPSSYRPSLEDFKKASKRIQGVAIRTQLIPLRWYDEDPKILLKPEMLQPIGSYKIRGVYNWVKKLNPERARAMNRLDMGIAFCHFDLSLKEVGVTGVWEVTDPDVASSGFKYVATWSRQA